jgi:hypothetical protein
MRSSNLIHLLGAAHEGGKFGVEARRVFEEGRMADPLIDRELGAGDHLRGVFGGDQVRVLDAIGGTADIDWPPASIAFEAYDPTRTLAGQICCAAQQASPCGRLRSSATGRVT